MDARDGLLALCSLVLIAVIYAKVWHDDNEYERRERALEAANDHRYETTRHSA